MVKCIEKASINFRKVCTTKELMQSVCYTHVELSSSGADGRNRVLATERGGGGCTGQVVSTGGRQPHPRPLPPSPPPLPPPVSPTSPQWRVAVLHGCHLWLAAVWERARDVRE